MTHAEPKKMIIKGVLLWLNSPWIQLQKDITLNGSVFCVNLRTSFAIERGKLLIAINGS